MPLKTPPCTRCIENKEQKKSRSYPPPLPISHATIQPHRRSDCKINTAPAGRAGVRRKKQSQKSCHFRFTILAKSCHPLFCLTGIRSPPTRKRRARSVHRLIVNRLGCFWGCRNLTACRKRDGSSLPDKSARQNTQKWSWCVSRPTAPTLPALPSPFRTLPPGMTLPVVLPPRSNFPPPTVPRTSQRVSLLMRAHCRVWRQG